MVSCDCFKDWSKKKKIIVGLTAFFVSGVLFGVLFWRFALKAVPQKEAEDMASPLKLEQFGEMAEFDGSVTVQSSFRTNNPTDISYFLTIDVDSYPTDAIPPISLNFVSTPDTTVPMFTVEDVENLEFPFLLTDYDPELYDDFIFIDNNGSSIGISISFASDSGRSSSIVLVSELVSRSAKEVGGTITLTNRRSVVDGEIIVTPQVEFKGIIAPEAPDVYLYLSLDGDFDDDDRLVSIEGIDNGRYAKTGNFIQDLSFDIDLEDYADGGTWILWCRRFSLLMGDGSMKQPTIPVMKQPSTTLVSELVTRSAKEVGGTITLTNRRSVVDGEIIVTPQVEFKGIIAPEAPDVYLYLSLDGDFDDDDRLVSIEGIDNGRYAKTGNFIQDLSFDIDLEDYVGGTWILWCRRFSLLMGDGEIMSQ